MAARASAKKNVKKSVARKPRRNVSYATYINRVLKGASKAKLTLSSKSMKIVNSLVLDFFEAPQISAAFTSCGVLTFTCAE